MAFEAAHHSENAREMMNCFYVGQYVNVSFFTLANLLNAVQACNFLEGKNI